MEQIDAFEAQNRFLQLLDQVVRGDEFIIARRGKPVAILMPLRPQRPPKEVIRDILNFQRRRSLGDLNLQALLSGGFS